MKLLNFTRENRAKNDPVNSNKLKFRTFEFKFYVRFSCFVTPQNKEEYYIIIFSDNLLLINFVHIFFLKKNKCSKTFS